MATDTYANRGDAGSSPGDAAQQAKDELRAHAGEAAHEVRDKARDLAQQARDQARTQLAGQKDRATEQLDSISSALRTTSDTLRDEEQDTVARYVGEAAQRIDRLSGYLRSHTAGELMDEAERYARREPALFLGGAMLLGLLGARFLKSSRPDDRGRGDDGGFGYERRYDRDDVGRRPARAYGGSSRATEMYEGGTYRSDPSARYGEASGDRYRPASSGTRGGGTYGSLHGTPGAEMPDPERRGASSERTTPSTTSSQTSLGREPREGGRDA